MGSIVRFVPPVRALEIQGLHLQRDGASVARLDHGPRLERATGSMRHTRGVAPKRLVRVGMSSAPNSL
jgi:hypothetical protein